MLALIQNKLLIFLSQINHKFFIELYYLQLNLRIWENPKGAFRMPPSSGSPRPSFRYTPGRLLGGGRIMQLTFSVSFFGRENGFVVVCVFPPQISNLRSPKNRKLANAQTVRFFNGDLDQKSLPDKEEIWPRSLSFTWLVCLCQTLLIVVTLL